MPWIVELILEQRGSKQDRSETAAFETREEAEAAIEQLKRDVTKAGPDDFIALSAPRRRIDFLKQDFRRVQMHERRPPGQVRRVI
jgi:hypothetical protein